MLRQLLLLLLFSCSLQLSAQLINCSPGLVLESVETEVGNTITVDVTARNLTDLVALQYNHSWNPGILDFVEVLYPAGSPINTSNFNFSPALTNDGLLNFLYIDGDLDGLGLADGEVLYQIVFVYLGGGTGTVSTNGDNLAVEFVNTQQQISANYYFLHATVGLPPMQVPPLGGFPSLTGACIQSQACNNPSLGRIFVEPVDDFVHTYSWVGPGGYQATEADISGLASGVYTLTMMHGSGQPTSGDFYVGSNSELTLSLAVDADQCGDQPDGSIFTNVSGGSGNYTYTWSNGATTANLSNLLAGDYSVTVTDTEGNCNASAQTTVLGIPAFSIWYESTNSSCDGASDGSITINSDANGAALPLSYAWSNGQSTSTITGLAAGFYTVTITSADGCNSNLAILLEEESFEFDANVTNNSCDGQVGGQVIISLSADDYDFNWSNGASGVNSIEDLAAGIYGVTVTDQATGCSATESYEVGDGEIISAYSVDCYFESGVSVADLNALVWTTDDAPYTFDWSNGISNTAETISSITVGDNGTYSVTITGISGCSSVIENIEVDCIGGSGVNLYFDPALSSMQNGDAQCFTVLADGFAEVVGFQFSMDWDENVLSYDQLQAFALTNLDATNFGTQLTADGKLTVSWLDPTTQGVSLPNESPLFDVCFTAASTEATTTAINISDFPTAIEFTNTALELLPVSSQSAVVNVNGGGTGTNDELSLSAGSGIVSAGNIICIPLSLGPVTDLAGFQTTLSWDPTVLQFTSVQSLNLPYLTETNSFGTLTESQEDGLLRILWSDASLQGYQLAQESTFMTACFLAIGQAGTYPVTFGADVLPTEGVNTDFMYMSTTSVGGEITIDGGTTNNDDTSLLINSTAVAPGESVCLGVEAVDFENIVGMQFSINWDNTLVTFDGIQFPTSSSLLQESDFNAPAGGNSLACSWIASDLIPRTLAAGTVLFEMCFTAGDTEGNSGLIFSNQPTAIEFIQNGSDIVPFLPVNGSITVSTDGLVWPGDLNNDGLANNFDLLHLGLAFEATGPERDNANINWQAQYTDAWSAATPESNTNYRHIDANGDGIINAADSLALSLNWSQLTDGFTGGETGGTQGFTGAPIYVQEGAVPAGVNVRIPIMLGNDENMVENAYGLAFTIVYDPEMVEANTPSIIYNGWLGDETNDLIGMYRDFPGLGQTEVVMVRTDGTEVDGSGQVAELSIIMEDVIIRSLIDVEVEFSIENVRLISYDETELSTSTRTTTILVEGVTNTDEPTAVQHLSLSPNPTAGRFGISHEGLILNEITLLDTKGRILTTLTQKDQQFDLSPYPAGIYFLQIQTDQGVARRKLIKQ